MNPASPMNKTKKALARLASASMLVAVPAAVWAQQATSALPASTLGQQNLRPYWHVFVAYTIVIVLVLVWVISIGRRLRDVEDRLGK